MKGNKMNQIIEWAAVVVMGILFGAMFALGV
jgi:hypothetical protein